MFFMVPPLLDVFYAINLILTGLLVFFYLAKNNNNAS